MEDDELKKRNTDCVYFLASPLTCKKGIECEYRHSEIARLNPRDCWFWLAGNCLNPTCAFRHPPLDGCPETSSEPAALPTRKTNVPCYFYFNGFCNKGNKCSFMHGPNDISSTLKASKSIPTVTHVHLENKSSAGSDTGPQLIEAALNPSDAKDNFHQSIPNDVERSPSPQISIPDCEEAMVTPLIAEDFIDSGSLLCPDQSSEERVGDCTEPEELWESSPGLDVLVDDGLENLGYEDDSEYLLVHDREAMEVNTHLVHYDYEDPAGYPMEYHPDSGIFYEHKINDSYDDVEDDNVTHYGGRVPEHSFQKRKFLPRQLEVNDRNCMDLREHLRKRRRINGHQASSNPKRRGSSFMSDRSQERHESHDMGHRRHGRLASEVGKNMVGVHSEKDDESNGSHQRSWMRRSKLRRNRSGHRERERRWQARPQFLPSEVFRGPTSRETRPTEESIPFTGPKTLAQIKEEKRKAWASEDIGVMKAGCQNRTTSEDTSRRSKKDYVGSEKRNCHFDEEDDLVDENGEDDDGLEKKLACIFS